MRKKMIVSGCSFTTNNYRSGAYPNMDCSWPKWPELLGEKLNMDVVNLAFSGAGNRFILQTLTEAIERTPKEEIGLVLAAWSQANRDDWQEHFYFNHKFSNEKHLKNFKWNNERTKRPGDVFFWVRETCLAYITLQNICKLYNLPYLQFQMISLFEGWLAGLVKTENEIKKNINNPNFTDRYEYRGDRKKDWKELVKLLLEYEQFIDTKNFLGWPHILKLNGYTIEEKIIMKKKLLGDGEMDIVLNPNLIIGGIDKHPNEEGHKKIAEFIYDRLG